ncbi:glycerophosphodiester phosphodiesterase family protein [Brachybacterium phenoliresistens]|uniref:glycerophosphodiester phosphodiesterase family protein n=1 Tax=Brachybacterium phenoliresistens TaxID=396014 RepID=UPI0031D4C900
MRSWTSTTADPPAHAGAPGTASRFLPGARPRLIAHRGLARDGAENTMRAFHDAIAAGATMLETDTRATADGVALAVHDATLERVAGDHRHVDTLRITDLPGIRVAGIEPIALLEDVLGSFGDVPVNIDVKDRRGIVPAVGAVARTRSADRICVTSFDASIARRTVAGIRATTGRAPARSPSRSGIAAFLAASALEAPRGAVRRVLSPYGAIQVPPTYRGVPVVTARTVAAAHGAGCEVHVWTIDDRRTMRDLLRLGVDGIITNRVDVLAELLESAPPPRS